MRPRTLGWPGWRNSVRRGRLKPDCPQRACGFESHPGHLCRLAQPEGRGPPARARALPAARLPHARGAAARVLRGRHAGGGPGLAEAGAAGAALPVVVDGDTVHAGATIERLAEAWAVFARPRRHHYDLFIVGAGPAGLAAAVYGASDGLSTAVAEADVPGGQAGYTSTDRELLRLRRRRSAARSCRGSPGARPSAFGAELLILNGVVRGHLKAGATPVAELSSGDEVSADIMIVAPGMEWRRLELDGVEELARDTASTTARAAARRVQCAGEHVMVVGAGNSAGQAVMNLASAGATVTMVVRGRRPQRSPCPRTSWTGWRRTTRSRCGFAPQVRELHEEAGQARGGDASRARTRRRRRSRSRRCSSASAACRARPGRRRAASGRTPRASSSRAGPARGREAARRLAARPRPAGARDQHPRRVRRQGTCGMAP